MRNAFAADFDLQPGYLNTASIGVPPVNTADAVAQAVRRWQQGLDRAADFDTAVATSRRMFAKLIGVPARRVAIGSTVSQLIGLVAASVPDGARVLVVRNEFTSVSFPFAAQARRGVTVAQAELTEIPDRAAEHDVVAVSAVQSADGQMIDLAALQEATRNQSTRVLVDVTQAAGWLPLEVHWADWVVAASYKWLMSPRGAAWLAVHPEAPEIHAHSANWYAAEDPWSATYGLPMRLAGGPRGLDLSPVWFAHVGAASALTWLTELDQAEVARHCTGLADAFRTGLGLPPAGSAIVAVDDPNAVPKLSAAGVRCTSRNGKARLAFHLYNTRQDVDLALEALRG